MICQAKIIVICSQQYQVHESCSSYFHVGWKQIADIESPLVNGSNYIRVTQPPVPSNSIFTFKDSNFLKVYSFVVFNSNTVNF